MNKNAKMSYAAGIRHAIEYIRDCSVPLDISVWSESTKKELIAVWALALANQMEQDMLPEKSNESQ